MMRSLYAGISGLRNFQTKMDIIGNNIANVNTTAFKSSRITFAETMAQTLSGEIAPTEGQGGINSVQVGLGMRTLSIDTNFSQGSLESTGVKTDLAIQGEGFFMVSNNDKVFYSRAGAFQLDADGNMVASGSGHRLMGYMADADGEINRSTPREIQIPLGRRSEARATTEVMLNGNLDLNMADSPATLIDAGTTGIAHLRGSANNGVGGRHEIQITGQNATQSIGVGQVQGIGLNETLASRNISDIDGFKVITDNDNEIEISGLTADSTVGDLINAINSQVSGVSAELTEGGEIQITRDFYGDGNSRNVTLQDPEGIGNTGIVSNLFGSNSFLVNNGTASTLAAIDRFTSSGRSILTQNVLEIVLDERTGLATGLDDIGGGGVFVNAPDGLAAGTTIVETEDTSHSTSIMAYDSLGNTTNLTITYTKTETPGTWQWEVSLPEPAVAIEGGRGEIRYADDGSLDSFQYDGNVTNLVFNPGNNAQDVSLTFNAGTIGEFDGMTQSASPTTTLANSQDGYGMGTLQGIFIDNNGHIFGNFTNGVTDTLAQVLLSNFTNPQGLERVGENMYRQTTNSGMARITDAEQGGARINAGFLEGSNVDLSREFTDMILAQRAFQASSRVITTSDSLLEEVTRLKS